MMVGIGWKEFAVLCVFVSVLAVGLEHCAGFVYSHISVHVGLK